MADAAQRHLALLLACGAFAVALALAARRFRSEGSPGRRSAGRGSAGVAPPAPPTRHGHRRGLALIAVTGLAFLAQRHYFARRS